jgi:hypothetical protein
MIFPLHKWWIQRPLRLLLITGFLLRLIAAIFSKGYGWQDDHFLVIEASQSWADGSDYNRWLPSSGAVQPDGHSFFYSGMHFLIFSAMKAVGIADPQLKMFIIRLLHAFFSMMIIYFGFVITLRLSDLKLARISGLLLSCFWFMPFLSVRNLIEFTTIPFLMWGLWILIRHKDNIKWKHYLLAGFIMCAGVSVRFQSAIIIAGVVAVLLFQKKITGAIALVLGAAISFVLLQSPVDIYIWGRPFAEFGEYVRYNLNNSESYGKNTWYSYLLVLGGMMIPPLSILLLFGFIRSAKKNLLLFFPAFLFLVFHSWFPNKQERFILTIVPVVIVAGVIGLAPYLTKERWLSKKWFRGSLWFAGALNLLLIFPVTTMYSKRARVESMYYLRKEGNTRNFIVEDRRHDSPKLFPRYYLGKWAWFPEINTSFNDDSLRLLLTTYAADSIPDFVLFVEDYDLKKRVDEMKSVFPAISYDTVVHPGFIDRLLYKANPKNANEDIYIYRTNFHPDMSKL